MIGKKKLAEIRRELAQVLQRLPAETPETWFEREIVAAEGQAGRDLETLKMLQAALQESARTKKRRLAKKSRLP
jgi:hypothetical protein